MKKLICALLAVLMLASLAACGDPAPATPTTSATPAATLPQERFCFTLSGVALEPWAAFDPAVLPEAESVYEVPSCAIEGNDKVYNYGTVEVTAYDDGTGPVIYSIYILDANTPTDEGLYLGDDLATVESLYGTDYTRQDDQLTYKQGDSLLVILLQDGYVLSIELRMDT
jgi:predicted small lipoprotein YifL